MFFNVTDLEKEIKNLQQQSLEKRRAFDVLMKNGMGCGELKTLFSEIKEIESRLELCFEEMEMQRRFR